MLALGASLIGFFPARLREIAFTAFGILLVLAAFGILRVTLPQRHYQLPTRVLAQPSEVAAAQFGFELGLGWRTYQPSLAPLTMATAALMVAPSLLVVLLVGVGFAFGRTLTPAVRAVSADTEAWDRTVDRLERPLSAVATLVCSSCVVVGTII